MGLTALASPPAIAFSRNPIYLKLNTDNTNCEAISMKLWIKKLDGTGDILTEFLLDTDRDGNVLFQINELLGNSMDDDKWPVPTLTATTIIEANQKIRYYYYECEEIETGAPNGQTHIVSEGSAKYVLLGGDSRQLWATEKWFDDIQAGVDPNFMFHTHKQQYNPIAIDQPDFLYFFNLHASAFNSMLKVVITRETGAPTTVNKYTASLLDAKKMHIIPVGYAALGLSAYETTGNPIVSYTVQLFEDGTTTEKSAARTIYLDRKYYGESIRLFIFFNSLGGFDVFRTIGGFAMEQNLEGQQRAVYVNPETMGNSTPDRVNTNRTETISYKGDTGYLPPKTIKYLRELMLSPMVFEYMVTPDKDYMLPIEITSNKVLLDDADNKPRTMAFEYRRLYDDHSLSLNLT